MIIAPRFLCDCLRVAFCFLIFAATLGCNLSSDQGTLVSGKVTIDGQLAKVGSISFVPDGQKYPIAVSKIIDGQYRHSMLSGKYKVMISSYRVTGESKIYNTPDSPTRKVTEEILPARYNDQTELEIEVGEEETNYNFDLSSK